jgi:hypothetical protein
VRRTGRQIVSQLRRTIHSHIEERNASALGREMLHHRRANSGTTAGNQHCAIA